jgi:TRAP-type mannitol/chloroaromatic compound transport system permease small subunit
MKLKSKELKLQMFKEYKNYYSANSIKDFDLAWQYLQRIHILSQPYAIEHTKIHFIMFWFAIRNSKWLDIPVQLLYSLFSAKFSILNIFPQGNTGTANDIFKGKMEVPADLQTLIKN